MKRKSSIVLLLCSIIYLNGCTQSFNPIKPDPQTGSFPTSSKLSKDEIKAFSPIDNINDQKFTVVIAQTNTSVYKNYGPFIKEMIENSGVTNLVSIRHLENFVIASNLGNEIKNLNNRIAFHQLSKYIGQYLVVVTDFERLYADWYQFSLTVYDPVSASTKFHVSHKVVNWIGLQRPLMLPAFNELKKWVEESKKISKKPTIKGLKT